MHTSMVTLPDNCVMLRKLGLAVLAFFMLAGLPSAARAQTPSVTLTPSVASPQKIGTPVTWTAAVESAPAGHTYDYQFTVTFNSQAQMVQDFSPTTTFVWVPYTVEGSYHVSVIVRDITAAPYTVFAPVSASFTLQPWVTAPGTQAVNPTSHPLVALFSAPPCTLGHQLLVRFRPEDSEAAMTTNFVPCSSNSANFLIAGMYPSTKYLMHWDEYDGASLVTTGTAISFTTGAIPSTIPAPQFQVNVPPTAHDAAYPVIVWDLVVSAFFPTATDLAGNVIWYFPVAGMARMEPGGIVYAIGLKTLAQYDLAGNQVQQTNLEILNEQLTAKGYPTLNGFNTHEARHLPNGNIVALGSRDVVSTSAQGGTTANPVDIVGDMVLVLDHNMQLVWAWDSFAHEDVNRAAVLGEVCTHAGGGCSPLFNPTFKTANDWLHTNFAQGTADGNIIISQRSQDWVLKINYANGAGDGSVIWRMGAGGDFTIVNPPSQTCGSPLNVFPWFTHQHDAAFEFEEGASDGAGTIMTVFDDGNTRNLECPAPQNSRGMVLFVNEKARQVYIETQATLGGYSFALGSGQFLSPGDGNLYASYGNGYLTTAGEAQSTEINLAGKVVYQSQVNSASYRTYRMPNLYSPTYNFTAPGVYTNTAMPLQFGTISAGTTEVQPLTVANFGLPGAATIETTANSASYDVLTSSLNTCQAGITAGQSCILPVAFNPASAGTDDDLLTVDAGGPSNLTVGLDGVAVPAGSPVAKISADYLPFGTIPFGTTETLPLTVTNTGGGTLTVATSFSGSSNYAISASTCGAGVTAGNSCTLQVKLTPTAIQTHYGVLTVQTNGGSPTAGLAGSVSGLSVFGGVDYGALQYGPVASGSFRVLTLSVTNVGIPGTVTVGTTITVRSTTTPTTTYRIMTTGNTCLAGIAAGQTCSLPVEFLPTTSGIHDDLLTLTPSAGGGSSLVWLNGTTP